MALRALQKSQAHQHITELQQNYLDIIMSEYGGWVPYGEKTKIAKRLKCTRSYLSRLDHGYNEMWTLEYERRLAETIPLANTSVQLAALQSLYENVIADRKRRSVVLSGKDPVEIIGEARKITQAPAHLERIQAVQNVNKSVTFQFGNLADDKLVQAVEMVTKMLRSGGLEEVSDLIEGAYDLIEESAAS